MATKTENLNLIKADEDEQYSIKIVNNNLDILDNAYKENKNSIKNISNNLNEYKEETTEKLTNVFTKEEVLKKIEDIIGNAPETLDTINEIVKALGDDPNFATTIINLLANKVDKKEGKVLTSNDYTDEEKRKLESAFNLKIPYILVEGENNVFVATVEGITEYEDGLPLCVKLPINATDICTLNLNGVGAITMQDSRQLKSNVPYNIRYEITSNSFILQTKGGGMDTSATATEEQILTGYTAWVNGNKLTGTAPRMVSGSTVHGVSAAQIITLPFTPRFIICKNYNAANYTFISQNKISFFNNKANASNTIMIVDINSISPSQNNVIWDNANTLTITHFTTNPAEYYDYWAFE